MKKSEIKAVLMTAAGVAAGFILYEIIKAKTDLVEKINGFDSANFDSANFDEDEY